MGYPGCVSLSRCAILGDIGGKTQVFFFKYKIEICKQINLDLNDKVYGLFSSVLLLIVILFLGPLFATLPTVSLLE